MPAARYTYPPSHRLGGKREFSDVYEAKVRESRAFLTVYARPNDLKHSRFGVSVSRKVGTAVRRNRIKRLLRESFRHLQADVPAAYDLVVVVRPHEPALLADYQRLLSSIVVKLHRAWQARRA